MPRTARRSGDHSAEPNLAGSARSRIPRCPNGSTWQRSSSGPIDAPPAERGVPSRVPPAPAVPHSGPGGERDGAPGFPGAPHTVAKDRAPKRIRNTESCTGSTLAEREQSTTARGRRPTMVSGPAERRRRPAGAGDGSSPPERLAVGLACRRSATTAWAGHRGLCLFPCRPQASSPGLATAHAREPSCRRGRLSGCREDRPQRARGGPRPGESAQLQRTTGAASCAPGSTSTTSTPGKAESCESRAGGRGAEGNVQSQTPRPPGMGGPPVWRDEMPPTAPNGVSGGGKANRSPPRPVDQPVKVGAATTG